MYRKLAWRIVILMLVLLYTPGVARMEGMDPATLSPGHLAIAPDPYEPDDTCAQATALPYLLGNEHTFHTASDVDWYWFDGPGGATAYSLRAYGDGTCRLELYRADCGTLIASAQDAIYLERAAEGRYYLKITAVGGWTGSYWPYMSEVLRESCLTVRVLRTGTQLGLANATLQIWFLNYANMERYHVATHVTGPDGVYRMCWYASEDERGVYEIYETDPPGCVSTGAGGGDVIWDWNHVDAMVRKGDQVLVTFYDTPPLQMELSPVNGASCVNSIQPFTASVTDIESAAQISAVEYVVDKGDWLVDAVYLRYVRASNLIYLRNEDNSGWLGGYAPGSGHILQNSRARVHLNQCAASTSPDGHTLQVTWAVEFTPAFAGTYNQFLYAERGPDFYIGFDQMGRWDVSYCGSPTPTLTPTATPQQWSCGTHTLQHGVDGYTGSQDVGISSWYPDQNYDGGINDVMAVRATDQLAGLIRFDLGMVPQQATITRATLSLYAARWHEPAPPPGRTLTVSVYEVYRPWVASQATWKLAQTGVPWGQAGCNDTTTDRAAQAASTVLMSAVGQWYDIDITALVQKWVSNPATNHGLVLKGTGSGIGVELVTMEHGATQLHPKLTIQCELPTTPTATWTPTPTRTPTRTPSPTPSAEVYLPLLLKVR